MVAQGLAHPSAALEVMGSIPQPGRIEPCFHGCAALVGYEQKVLEVKTATVLQITQTTQPALIGLFKYECQHYIANTVERVLYFFYTVAKCSKENQEHVCKMTPHIFVCRLQQPLSRSTQIAVVNTYNRKKQLNTVKINSNSGRDTVLVRLISVPECLQGK